MLLLVESQKPPTLSKGQADTQMDLFASTYFSQYLRWLLLLHVVLIEITMTAMKHDSACTQYHMLPGD